MKTHKVNLARVAAHDFWRSMRAWRSDIEPRHLVELLTDQRSKSMNNSVRSFLLALILALWITNSKKGNDVSLEVFSLSLTFPVVYVSFAISFINLVAFVSFLSYLNLNEFLRLVVRRYYKFDNSTAMAMPFDGSAAWSLGAMQQYRFLKSNPMHILLAISILIAIVAPAIAVLVYIYLVVFDVSVASLSLTISSPFGIALSIISLLLLAFSIVLVIVLYLPFTFAKNASYVRWNFLSTTIYRRAILDHLHLEKWLEK